MREEINPVRCEQGKNKDAYQTLLDRAKTSDSQARHARRKNDARVNVEDRHRAQKRERERIPFPGGKELEVEKRDCRSRCSARDAGEAGEIVK